MVRFFCTCLLACLMSSPAMAQSSKYSCRVSAENLEQIDIRFVGMGYQLLAFSLAEKYCGAKPKPMKERFLGYLEKNGCGPGTEVYSVTEETVEKMEGASLATLAQGGTEEAVLSKQEVREWAESTTSALGGCGLLTKGHDTEK